MSTRERERERESNGGLQIITFSITFTRECSYKYNMIYGKHPASIYMEGETTNQGNYNLVGRSCDRSH